MLFSSVYFAKCTKQVQFILFALYGTFSFLVVDLRFSHSVIVIAAIITVFYRPG